MKIAILGTGVVGQTLAGKLSELGHEVVVGTRDPKATLARAAPDAMGNPPYSAWQAKHPRVRLASFAEAAAHGALIINATNGAATMGALQAAGARNLDGKILLDVSNPLDFSKGMPPSLFVCNTDSLAEQIQRAYPKARVVKSLNSTNAFLMVAPQMVAGGDHTMFLSGNDAAAKQTVREILTAFGWRHILDLGDLSGARGQEMVLPLWVRLFATMGTPMFNYKVATANPSNAPGAGKPVATTAR